MIGIEFTMKDGSKDWYDPLRGEEDLIIKDDVYIVKATYDYEIEKSKVESYKFYDCCEICGIELHEEKGCDTYECKNNKYDE